MKKTKIKHDEDLNFWQSTSDLMSGLMYMLMLVILLLGLHLMQLPEHQELDPNLGDTYTVYATPTPSPGIGMEGETQYQQNEKENGGNTGAGQEQSNSNMTAPGSEAFSTPDPFATPTPSPTPTPTPTPVPASSGGGYTHNEYTGYESETTVGERAAVFVKMVDATTDQTVKQENVEFELYLAGGALQVLNSYYPQRATYRVFQTTGDGTFYFPEKLADGEYELHELSEPEGYDAADNVVFLLDSAYDWPEPYVVEVPMLPSQNSIRVQVTDIETGANIAGGSFEIIAADNIITQDGTVRYRTGQSVGVIECNNAGFGKSDELFLGSYFLHQLDIPENYASYREDIGVEVSKKTASLPAPVPAYFERTRITINVADELYDARVVEGAEFSITPSRGLPFTATSDHLGKIKIENITKGTTYRITQTAAPGNYRLNPAEYTLNVSADGRINGEASAELNLSNRMIRVSIGLTDEFSNVQIPGVSMSLYNASDEPIHSWTTTGVVQNYEDLAPGSYYVVIGDDSAQRHDILVRDQAAIQHFTINSSFMYHYLLYGIVALVVLLAGAVFILVRRKKKKAAMSEEGMNIDG